MISQILMIFTLISIWLSLAWGLVILISAVQFWLKHSDFRVDTSPLLYYPKVTIVVPAHNEDVVIAQTAKAILDMNYPHDRVELLLFADNCSDRTYEECLAVKALPEYAGRDVTIIDRTGTGGKAGVLNDALKMATGDYICVYDADAMPEKNALYFLVKEVLKDPERHVAWTDSRNQLYYSNRICQKYRWLEEWCLDGRYGYFLQDHAKRKTDRFGLQLGSLPTRARDSKNLLHATETLGKRELRGCTFQL